MKRNPAAGTSHKEDESSFPEVQFLRKQSSSSLRLPPLPDLQCSQVYIVFKCQREKEEESEGEKPLWLWLSHSGEEGRKAERTSGGIKEMQIFLPPRPYSGLQSAPLPSPVSLLPSPGLHWNVKCSSLQLKGGSLVGTDCPSNLQVQAGPFCPCVCFPLSWASLIRRFCLGWRRWGRGRESDASHLGVWRRRPVTPLVPSWPRFLWPPAGTSGLFIFCLEREGLGRDTLSGVPGEAGSIWPFRPCPRASDHSGRGQDKAGVWCAFLETCTPKVEIFLKPGVSKGVENRCFLKLLEEAKWESFPESFLARRINNLTESANARSSNSNSRDFFSPPRV